MKPMLMLYVTRECNDDEPAWFRMQIAREGDAMSAVKMIDTRSAHMVNLALQCARKWNAGVWVDGQCRDTAVTLREDVGVRFRYN